MLIVAMSVGPAQDLKFSPIWASLGPIWASLGKFNIGQFSPRDLNVASRPQRRSNLPETSRPARDLNVSLGSLETPLSVVSGRGNSLSVGSLETPLSVVSGRENSLSVVSGREKLTVGQFWPRELTVGQFWPRELTVGQFWRRPRPETSTSVGLSASAVRHG